VSSVDRSEVGELAFRNGIVVHELTTRIAALEDAFLEATGATEEFRADDRLLLAGATGTSPNGDVR
jgi:ABC-2 type transport system ATP-binding protein